jgi:DNA-binding HxlR family transcriptional regulator
MKSINIEEIDELIHSRIRLGIISVLASMDNCDFRHLKDTLGCTDGNLSTHLAKLHEAGYLEVERKYEKKPQSIYRLSVHGRNAFIYYISSLENIIAINKKNLNKQTKKSHSSTKSAAAEPMSKAKVKKTKKTDSTGIRGMRLIVEI